MMRKNNKIQKKPNSKRKHIIGLKKLSETKTKIIRKGETANSFSQFNSYLLEGFKPVLCAGYHPRYNRETDSKKAYDRAKQPIKKGFKKEGYQGPTIGEIKRWMSLEGGIGWFIPKGFFALDIEDDDSITYFESFCEEKKIEPSVHITNNGKHYLFKINKELPGSTKVYTKLGIKVTYRAGGENILVLAPIYERKWQLWKPLEELPIFPEELYPYDRKNIDDVVTVLSWQVGSCWRKGLLQGWDDIDTSYMALLVEQGLSREQIQTAFQKVYLDKYDDKITTSMYERTKERIEAGEIVRGAGSFVRKLKEFNISLEEFDVPLIQSLIKLLQENTSPITPTEKNYFVDNEGYLCRYKSTKRGKEIFKLANFDACITEEISEDNGLDITHTYAIEGKIKDRPLSKIKILASQFASLNWIHNWGNNAILEPGQSIKDYVRHYIQINSKNAIELIHYTHTGWREIDGALVYLTKGGAIGADNVSVQLVGELEKYSIPLQVENEQEAIEASLSFLDIGSWEITLPLLCFGYLSPLTTILNPMPNFSLFIHGPTGTLKTTLSILALSHFGDFRGINKLSNFEDTPNAIERRAFILKDVLMVLDDYHPASRVHEAQKMEQTAQRVLRAFSNRTGRARLKSDISERGRYEPRGMLLITGEELVSVQSTLARCLVLDIKHADINKNKLSELQTYSELFPHAMSSFIHWLRERIDDIKAQFSEEFFVLRKEAFKTHLHAKLPEQVAFLQFSLRTMIQWMRDKNILIESEANALEQIGWEIFIEVTNKQAERIESEDPVRRFLEIIHTVIIQGKVRLEDKNLSSDIIGHIDGELIGYYDESYLYLIPTAIWNVIKRYCKQEGSHFPISNKHAFYKMLDKAKLMETKDGRSTLPKRIRNQVGKYLVMYRNVFFEHLMGEEELRNLQGNLEIEPTRLLENR